MYAYKIKRSNSYIYEGLVVYNKQYKYKHNFPKCNVMIFKEKSMKSISISFFCLASEDIAGLSEIADSRMVLLNAYPILSAYYHEGLHYSV